MNKSIRKIEKKFSNLSDSTKKAIIIGVTVFLIVLLVFIYIASKSNENFKNIKQDKSKYLVYSKVERQDEKYPKYVPFINIKADVINQANADIDSFVNSYLDSDKALITYEYNINGILLSVVVKVIDYQKDYAPEIYFRTYNINLDTRQLISDQSLLNFFQIDETTVSSLIEERFREYYKDLVEENYYVPEECNYECFLDYRNVDNYLDNVNYYIKNGNLIAYKPFIFYSIFEDEKYFTEDHFEFLLVETDKN